MSSKRDEPGTAVLPYYEAGRAILAAAFGVAPEAVTVDPADRMIGLGGCRVDVGHALTLHQRLIVAHAGKLAAIRACPHVGEHGFGAVRAADPVLEALQRRARELVRELWPAIERLAAMLRERQTVASDAVVECLDGFSLLDPLATA